MNPFVTFVIIIPLIVSIVFTVAAVGSIYEEGAKWDIIAAFFIMFSISGVLIYLLKRTSRAPYVEIEGSEQLDELSKRRLTAWSLFSVYAIAGIVFVLLVLALGLRYWAGFFFLLLGLTMLYSAMTQLFRNNSLPPKSSVDTMTRDLRSLETALAYDEGNKNRSLVFMVVLTALAVLFYLYLEGAFYFSPLDLFGFIILEVCWWIWSKANRIATAKRIRLLKRELEQGVSRSEHHESEA